MNTGIAQSLSGLLIIALAFTATALHGDADKRKGLLAKASGVTETDVTDAEIWVMDPKTEYFEQTKALKDTDLTRVRGVDGVLAVAEQLAGAMKQPGRLFVLLPSP